MMAREFFNFFSAWVISFVSQYQMDVIGKTPMIYTNKRVSVLNAVAGQSQQSKN
jgi:hypothetical protein